MNAIELVCELQRRGVEIEAGADTIRYRPREAVSGDLLSEMMARKGELLNLLSRGPVQTINCLVDDCSERITLIRGSGWCKSHRMSIMVIEGEFVF